MGKKDRWGEGDRGDGERDRGGEGEGGGRERVIDIWWRVETQRQIDFSRETKDGQRRKIGKIDREGESEGRWRLSAKLPFSHTQRPRLRDYQKNMSEFAAKSYST